MCTRFSAAVAATFAVLVTATPAAAFSFGFNGRDALDARALERLVESHVPGRFIEGLMMRPHGGRVPRESIYMLCAHAQGKVYVVGVRPDAYERDCIRRQEAANGVRVDGLELIYPDRWYCVLLTPEELANVVRVGSIGCPRCETPQPPAVTDTNEVDSLKGRIDALDERIDANERIDRAQTDLLGRLAEAENTLDTRLNTVERGLASERSARMSADEEREAAHEAMERRLSEIADSVDSNDGDDTWVISDMEFVGGYLRYILFALLALILAIVVWSWKRRGLRKQSTNKSMQTAQPADQAPVQPAPAPTATPTPAPSVPQTAAATPPSSAGGFLVEVTDREGKKHAVAFGPAPPDSRGRERGFSPWTRNPILRIHADAHAQEHFDKEGLPK